MRKGDAFQSQYLRTDDLKGKEHLLTIKEVELCQINDQETGQAMDKAVIFFQGAKKGMVINMTNWETLEEAYGAESDDWKGYPVVVYPTTTRFGNKKVPCMRMRIPKGSELRDGEPPKHSKVPDSDPFDDTPPPTDDDAPPADEVPF